MAGVREFATFSKAITAIENFLFLGKESQRPGHVPGLPEWEIRLLRSVSSPQDRLAERAGNPGAASPLKGNGRTCVLSVCEHQLVISGREETSSTAHLCRLWIFIMNVCFFVTRQVNGTKLDSGPSEASLLPDSSG